MTSRKGVRSVPIGVLRTVRSQCSCLVKGKLLKNKFVDFKK
jgi:hypothetical protein